MGFYFIVWFQKISIPPPPPHGRDLPYDPPSPLDFPKSAPKIYPTPLPSGISKLFVHALDILLSLIEVNKEVVLFTKMYFLLNCITDKRILYANSLCAQVTDKFCAFHVILQYCKWNARSRSKHIFHTIGEISSGNARVHAQFRFDLHSFDQNIFSFENSLF